MTIKKTRQRLLAVTAFPTLVPSTVPIEDQRRQQESAEGHAAIVETIARGDADDAARAMKQVIETGRKVKTAPLPGGGDEKIKRMRATIRSSAR